ncbi:MAG: membrane protein insertase YidC [Proteobacteria bacterium]|nr:membrane protein insertase YidC [Pseudomonadota bacterium]
MDTTRFILLISLGLVLTMIWQAWQEDYGEQYQEKPVEHSLVEQELPAEDLPDLKSIDQQTEQVFAPSESLPETESQTGAVVNVKTDVLDLDINMLGATIQRLALTEYPVDKNRLNKPVVLLRNETNDFYLLQGGLLSKNETANHKTEFMTDQETYDLGEADQITVPFYWRSESGLNVVKTFTFYKGKYVADVEYQIENSTTGNWSGSAYSQINRTGLTGNGSKFIYTYTGAVISSPEKRYEKIDFDDIQDNNLSLDIVNGWAAMLQHYFITALIPGSKQDQYHYYTLNPDKKSYVIGAIAPAKNISAGDSAGFNHRVYFGPKTQKELKQLAEGLELTVDYGIFWFIAKPLFWVLDYINHYTNNWGWSIILVTLLLKIIFYRLSAAGYRSMANMRRVQPRLLSIKERYKDDRARLNQAMMDIYKEEKINPLGGCFPILVQIPVFISLYWVLLESVELRQADFVLWINDLSAPDPYFVLPLLMGVTMFVQQKLNPAPLDPVQEKVMTILPIVFTVFFAFFPSGLVLYWVVNNILSIAQQWAITRSLEKAGLAK